MKRHVRDTLKLDNESFFDAVKESLRAGNRVKIRVIGGSMSPFLKHGEEVVIEPMEDSHIKAGAVVLGEWKNGYVLHRIVGVGNGVVRLAGDNNLGQVEYVRFDQLLGLATGVARDSEVSAIGTPWRRRLALTWYYVRPLRRVWAGIFNLLSRKK